ncbi:hypothetical protein CHUAL_010146 [Chamberlinius hualienensis]
MLMINSKEIQRAPEVCGLQLVIEHFHLEYSEGCLADYLEIQGKRLCGTLPPKSIHTFTFTADIILIRFHSNALVVDAGFLISAEQISCGQQPAPLSPVVPPYNCDVSYSQPEFEITSPLYPKPYPNNAQCNYVIKKSSIYVCAIIINVVFIDLEVTNQCFSDFLQWNQHKFCYPPPLIKPIDFNEETFNIRFQSGINLRQRLGFRLSIRQRECPPQPPPQPLPPPFPPIPHPLPPKCELTFTQQKFQLLPPAEKFVDCTFIIVKASVTICALSFTFVEINFNLIEQTECLQSFIQIGGDRLCTRRIEGSTRVYAFKEQQMVINVHNELEPIRFRINVEQQPCLPPQPQPHPLPPPQPQPHPIPPPQPYWPYPSPYCPTCPSQGPNVFGAQYFTIRSPNFPANYADGLDCLYTVLKATPYTCQLYIRFQFFDVEVSESCRKDSLVIDNEIALCGQRQPGFTKIINFYGNDVKLKFKTDVYGNRRGFIMEVWQMNCYRPRPLPPAPSPCYKGSKHLKVKLSHVSSNWRPMRPCYFDNDVNYTPYEGDLNGIVYKRAAVTDEQVEVSTKQTTTNATRLISDLQVQP